MPLEQPLPATTDSLEVIPEAFRDAYVEKDGHYILFAKVEEHPNTLNLRSALQKERGKLRPLEEQLAKVKDIDPERWAKLKDLQDEDLEQFTAWREEQAKGNGNKSKLPEDVEQVVSKRTETMRKKYDGQIDSLTVETKKKDQTIDALRAELTKNKIETAVVAACAELKVRSAAIEDVQLWALKRLRINDEGKVVAVGPDGEELFDTDAKTPLDVKGLISQQNATKAHWFEGSSGGGAGGGNGGGGGHLPAKPRSKMTVAEKSEFINKHGHEKYNDLPY